MAAVPGDVRTLAVIGAGPVGRGIAQLAARGGYRTILEDLLPNALRRAESEIRSQLDRAVDSGGVSSADADAAFSRLEFAGTVEDAAREADLVIEAVPEELESKIEIFTLLDKICRPGTILASHLSNAQHYRDFPRHLSRQKLSGYALRGASRPREEARNHPRPGDGRRDARHRGRSRAAHGKRELWSFEDAVVPSTRDSLPLGSEIVDNVAPASIDFDHGS